MLLPMTLGIMTGSILSGQLIARTGRYRIFPIIGSATLTLAMLAMSLVGADTPLALTMSSWPSSDSVWDRTCGC